MTFDHATEKGPRSRCSLPEDSTIVRVVGDTNASGSTRGQDELSILRLTLSCCNYFPFSLSMLISYILLLIVNITISSFFFNCLPRDIVASEIFHDPIVRLIC